MILTDDVVERCAMFMALREWPSDDPKDPITWPGDFSDRERATYHILARAALEAARYGELVEALKNTLPALDEAHREVILAIRAFDGGEVHYSQFSVAATKARALLSTIGEPNLKGDRG